MSTPNPVDRELRLAAIPDLSELHPDDRASLAHRAQSWGEGERVREACEVNFLLSGRVTVGSPGCGVEAPSMIGATETLAGVPTRVAMVGDRAELIRLAGDDLSWVMEDVFEVWLAMTRHVAARWDAPGGDRDTCATPSMPRGRADDSLAGRIVSLRRCDLFAGLRVHALGRLALRTTLEEASAGAPIWEREAPADDILLLLAGRLCSGGAGPAMPGSLLGLRSALAGEVRVADVFAIDDSRVLRLRVEALVDELEDDPDAASCFLRALARRTLEASDRAWRGGEAT